MKSICSSLVLLALVLSIGCNDSKPTAIEDSDGEVFEKKIRSEQESAIKSHGAEGRLIESIASESQVKIDDWELLDNRLFTIDLQRYFQRPRKVCVSARMQDIIQNGQDFTVRFHVASAQLRMPRLDLKASESQVLALLKDRPGGLDEYVVVLESSKFIRREIEISTNVGVTSKDDEPWTAEAFVSVEKVLQGSLIYFKLVRY